MATAERKPFLLRIDADLHAALSRWADDELRSLNGQIEFLLNRILVEAGRSPTSGSPRPLAPRPAARKPPGVRARARSATLPGRQPEHASGKRRREPVSPQAPPPPAARTPVDTSPPARSHVDDWDAMVD